MKTEPRNIFERINDWIEDAEGSIITLVTTLIPWLAPLLPAYLTGHHLIVDIKIPWPVAIPMAVTVELLGLSAIATAFAAMRHNKTNKKVNRVSLGFPIGAYVFYILVVLITNVVLSLPLRDDARPYVYAGVIAMLTLISAPAFIIAVARQEQHNIDKDVTAARAAKTQNVTSATESVNVSDMSIDDICHRYNVTPRTAYRWKGQGYIPEARRNGHEKERVEL